MYDKVLLAIDLAEESSWERALPVAVELARAGGKELHVVTVVPTMGMSIVGSFMQEGAEEKALHATRDRLKTFLDAQAPADLTVKGHVLKGTIYQEIINAADLLGCEVIVMASHRPELKDYLLGPNAASVVRHAKQSVHVVRA